MIKGLEALEKLNHTICLNLNNKTLQFNLDKYEDCDCKDIREFCDCYEVIEKELKAFNIVRTKNVNIDWLKHSQTLEDYIHSFLYIEESRKLTQEEFDLLKEVLNNGR